MRSFCASLTLFLSALIAHVVGCGTFIPLPRLFLESTFLIAIIAIFSRYNFEGPRLGFIVLISQASVHIVLGGMLMNTSLMLKTHLVFGIFSYLVISHLEKFWDQAKIFISGLVNFPSLNPNVSALSLSRTHVAYIAIQCPWDERSGHTPRAPPASTLAL